MTTGFGISLTASATTIIGVVAFVYFIAIMLFGTYFSRFSKNLNDYFYSGQRFAWWLAAASMVATGIGSYSYLKYTEQGFNTGLSSTMTYLNDWFIVPFFMFGWLPIIYFARVRSIPEYFERRFGRTARYLAVVIIMMYMFFYIGYNLFTMGVAIEGLFGIPQIWSIPVITFLIGVYVTFGGQTAVIFTDLVQGIMLYLAGGVAIFAGLWALGGFGEFWGWLPITHRLPFVDLLADAKFNASGLFWGEALAGSIAFTFMNQGFIMRYLTIRSVNEGRKASLFNVAITLPLSAIVCGAVGWLAKSIVTKQAAMGGALAGIEPIHIQNTFHTFIVVCWETLKHNSWLFGFVVAALTAALMSTVDTLINACAAIGIFDIYKPLIKPDADDKHYLKAARWASAFATILGLLLVIWFNRQEGTLMSIHYKGIMLIIPPIVTTIFLGAFWRRFNAIAASIAMLVGIGFTMATNWFPKLTHPLAWFVVGNKNDIYMPALFGMLVTAVVGVIITLLTKPDTQKDITGLTVDTLDEAMVIYKGGTPNHAIGKTVKRIAYRLDESIPFGLVSASMAAMERMKANEGDMCYLTDARGWLGGLRSQHVKFAAPHALPDNVVLMSKETKEDAFLLDDRPVTLDKIF